MVAGTATAPLSQRDCRGFSQSHVGTDRARATSSCTPCQGPLDPSLGTAAGAGKSAGTRRPPGSFSLTAAPGSLTIASTPPNVAPGGEPMSPVIQIRRPLWQKALVALALLSAFLLGA